MADDVVAGAAAGAAVPGIDPVALDAWFAGNVEGARPPLHFEVITGGRSNITYRVVDSVGNRFVLRRPPLGHVLATAHDMAREHRIIGAVGKTAVPVPQVLALCEDVEVNGAPFYVMSFVDGHVLAKAEDTTQALPDIASRWRVGEHVADIMADLHTVDVDAIGLGELARREAFLDRQLKRWRGQWDQSKTRELPDMDAAFDLLMAHKPEQRYTGIVHGDFRIGNMLAVVAGEPEGAVADPGEPGTTSRRCSTGSCARSVTSWPTSATSSTTGRRQTVTTPRASWTRRPPRPGASPAGTRSSSATQPAAASTCPRSSTTGRSATGARPPSSRA